jgi:Flp pilus assembly pilin Flp
VEYALIAVFIGLGAVASLNGITQSVANAFSAVNNTLTGAF